MNGIQIREYAPEEGHSRFSDWFNSLDTNAAIKVQTAVERMRLGNFSHEKALKGGLFERRVDSGPGYRVYYGRDGLDSIVLLNGGTKEHQAKDIQRAQTLWDEYRRRKR